jgi:hypothetical protein
VARLWLWPGYPEDMSEQDARELLEDLADAAVAREALSEPGESVPWEQVRG